MRDLKQVFKDAEKYSDAYVDEYGRDREEAAAFRDGYIDGHIDAANERDEVIHEMTESLVKIETLLKLALKRHQ